MKLTKSSLKEMIREVIREEKQLNESFGTPINPDVVKNPMDYASDKRDDSGGIKMFYNSYSSSEAKKVVEGRLKEYVQQLRNKMDEKYLKKGLAKMYSNWQELWNEL